MMRRAVSLKRKESEKKKEISITLAGVPNVGKSTVFNALTGMNQHTGNWAGKTVESAIGSFRSENAVFNIADIPGTYSLFTHSAEEDIAKSYIMAHPDNVTVAVCDASSPERSLPLALQILEVTDRCIIFMNLSDEAAKKGILTDADKLSAELGVPVICGSARSGKGIKNLIAKCESLEESTHLGVKRTEYPDKLEKVLTHIESEGHTRAESAAIITENAEEYGFADQNEVIDIMTEALIAECGRLCSLCVERKNTGTKRDRILDRLFCGKVTGFPIMALMLTAVFWITLKGANYPSEALWKLFSRLGKLLTEFLRSLSLPEYIVGFAADGVYKMTAWIVSVMLPPMAIFFPLFTLLEDFGYLPRVAFDLDRCCKKCGGCGKQALCMCMGLGCNAVGVTGCRIIDSKRERLIAILTNSFIPCNGRFPALLILISAFFLPSSPSGFAPALIMTGFLTLSVTCSFLASKILSITVLKGVPSSFTLELPPYRAPKIIETVTRSVFDRTLFVLGRAVSVAAPAGAVIWMAANITVGGAPLLQTLRGALDPIGHMIGIDGAILLAFILGIPANEIILPIIIMIYMSSGTLAEANDISFISEVLISNGWTSATALCTMILFLFHSPCSTTLLTVKKETGSIKYTVISALLPIAFGAVICFFVNLAAKVI